MGKMKVYELAKKVGMSNKDFLMKLKELNIEIKSYLSVIEDEDVKKIYTHFDGENKEHKKNGEEKMAKKVAESKEVKKDQPRIIRREIVQTKEEHIEKVPEKERIDYELKPKQGANPEQFRRSEAQIEKKKAPIPSIQDLFKPKKDMQVEETPQTAEPSKPEISKTDEIKSSEKVVEATENPKKEWKDTPTKPAEKPNGPFSAEKKEWQSRPQSGTQSRPQGGYQGRPQGGPQGGPQSRPQGGYQGRPQGGPQSRPQGGYQGRPQGGPQGGPQSRPQGGYQGRPQGGPQGGPQSRPQGGYQGRPQGGTQGRPQSGSQSNNKGQWSNKTDNKPVDKQIKKAFKDAPSAEKLGAKENTREQFKPRPNNDTAERKPSKSAKNIGNAENFNREHLKELRAGHKVSELLNEDTSVLMNFYDLERNGKRNRKRKEEPRVFEQPKQLPFSITVGEFITVKDLAEKLKKTSADLIKRLLSYGTIATLNHEVDYDTAAIMAEEYGIKIEKEVIVKEEDVLFDDSEDITENMTQRPPIVVVMGHVDHGKTSLLDAIRETHVIDTEAGGITQHIGASTVVINGRELTFLDTPGHEAFTAMRARGAKVTDIAILVVAADDGIMPQTVEAINHAKAAGVSLIVAINKIDKEGANIDRVKQDLMTYGVVPEEWGGDAICVPVSAKKRIGIDTLLETVTLVADVLELKADPTKQAKGTIIEAKLDKGRGPVATLLVQRGTINVGDTIIAGNVVGHIRAMNDARGKKIKKAGPSKPAEIIGLQEVPESGEIFYVVKDEKVAKQLVEKRKIKRREDTLRSSSRVTLEDLFSQIAAGKVKDLNIIIKADVQGSVEAIKQSLEKITNEEVKVKVIHGAVGAINESDVMLAQVANAIIIGFNVISDPTAKAVAERESVDIKYYRIIYDAIEDVTSAMKGMLAPKFKEKITGHAEIRQIFKIPSIGTIAGCYITDGKIARNSQIRLIRDGIVTFEGKLTSLKREKDDVKEIAEGYECGIGIEKFNDMKEKDIIEAFVMEEIKI